MQDVHKVLGLYNKVKAQYIHKQNLQKRMVQSVILKSQASHHYDILNVLYAN